MNQPSGCFYQYDLVVTKAAAPRNDRSSAQSVARETSSPESRRCVKGKASSCQQASPSQWPTSCSTQNLFVGTS